MNEEEFRILRERMIDEQLWPEVTDGRVLDAMRQVPRHRFVPVELRRYAYDNRPLALPHGQTISQPLMVGLMLQDARLTGTENVLDVGAGSGYQAAILSVIAEKVVTIERIPELASSAAAILQELGFGNVEVVTGDGSLGWPPGAPYDRIIVAAGGKSIAEPLIAQLAPEGILVMPVGHRMEQTLKVVSKSRRGTVSIEDRGSCAFVPLIGEAAWPD